ncbi:MAG: DUF3179 domain-containing protein [Gemmatimonadetes bacterium]|nr:MAG: DUF3179 domain-containing protein [Gemmatimonadota bacterium]
MSRIANTVRRTSEGLLLGAGLLALASCGGDGSGLGPGDGDDEFAGLKLDCQLASNLLADGGPGPEGIYALTEPKFVEPGSPELSYLRDDDRVVGLIVNGDVRAYPHNIFWWHELVNDVVGGRPVAISFCPLTGSAVAIDPVINGRRVEFGISGLLFANNLVMFDRETDEVYGPQLFIEGRCNAFKGIEPSMIEVAEMTWGRWKELHPETKVLSGETSFNRPYTQYPYGSYDQLTNNSLLFPMSVDNSRPIKERVLGIRVGDTGGKAYPFGELENLGPVSVVNDVVGGDAIVIFYEAANRKSAHAFHRTVGGQTLTFEVVDGQYRDVETGSTWDLAGRAVGGPMTGEQLDRVDTAYTVFWFAWRHFQPDAATFQAS